jgi:hypothetical protein
MVTVSPVTLEGLGVRQEPLRKRHLPGGRVRDTVQFAVTDDHWPSVKKGLMARLGG